jgi:exoribonuclease II
MSQQAVMYEEDGSFKVANVMSEADASLQVESTTGKRSKIKANHVVLRFAGESLTDFLVRADAVASELDPQFLWEVCGPAEFGFTDLAKEWFGRVPKPVEAAAVALKLHGAPMYFYKRGKGRYQAAPEENLKAALASAEKKRRQQAQIDAWVADLQGGVLPAAFGDTLPRLLFKPDRNTLEVKALEAAADAMRMPIARIMVKCGAYASAADWHLARFRFEKFVDGPDFSGALDALLPLADDLPTAECVAFSIDDEETTEVDDAFSVTPLATGRIQVGIHIAAPALTFSRDSDLDRHAGKQLSTVYYPGGKITMLPAAAVAASTLDAERMCPTLSLYLEVDAASLDVVATRTVAERVAIVANLRHNTLEDWFHDAAIADGEVGSRAAMGEAFARELLFLHRFAQHLKAHRGATDQTDRQDYVFRVKEGHVTIGKRARGGAIDTVVAELMIHINATWGRQLADLGVTAIYRNQVNNRTRMETSPAQHEGLGVSHYAWSSSPIRRYVDLVNQRQLLASLDPAKYGAPLAAAELDLVIRDFEAAYDAYNEFQRQMERYWCLVYMQQHAAYEWDATLIREELVRFADLPLITKVVGVPGLPAGTHIRVAVAKIDLWSIDFSCRYLEKRGE